MFVLCYIVTAFDLSEAGIEKGKKLAEKCNTYVDFFKADITDFRASEYYDIIFSSGVYHFIKPEIRKEITTNLKEYTNKNGIHAINVFVDKPFVKVPPDKDTNRFRWNSGELFMLYHDWKLHKTEEVIFNYNSGGIPHQISFNLPVIIRNGTILADPQSKKEIEILMFEEELKHIRRALADTAIPGFATAYSGSAEVRLYLAGRMNEGFQAYLQNHSTDRCIHMVDTQDKWYVCCIIFWKDPPGELPVVLRHPALA